MQRVDGCAALCRHREGGVVRTSWGVLTPISTALIAIMITGTGPLGLAFVVAVRCFHLKEAFQASDGGGARGRALHGGCHGTMVHKLTMNTVDIFKENF